MKALLILFLFITILFAEHNYSLIEKEHITYLKYKELAYRLNFRPFFCEGVEDGCRGTGVYFKEIEGLKEPLILLKSLKGAHSIVLNIYNPNTDRSKEVKHYMGSYSVEYEESENGYDIVYDAECNYPNCPNYQLEFYSPNYLSSTSFYFEEDRFSLSKKMLKRVKKLAKFYLANSTRDNAGKVAREILLTGHTSILGTDEYNFAIGAKRASYVKIALIKQGVPQSQIKAISVGEMQQICQEQTSECYDQNNRVEFKIW